MYWKSGVFERDLLNGCELIEELGSGSFGTVYKCINKDTK